MAIPKVLFSEIELNKLLFNDHIFKHPKILLKYGG